MRLAQPVSLCQAGLGSYAEQPEPVPLHTSSLDHVLSPFSCRVVPPTAVTYWDAAGNSTPYPLSPEEAVIITPGWLKYLLSSLVSLEYSLAP